ncbi:hypothetical protein FACS1894120_4880 [Clostridia bacterium]|nr:hypothetical protein FACS1894120_4880 [Clostridia bacterium]
MTVAEIKEKFGLIGNPLGHSMSPFIHGELFKLAGVHGQFDLYPVPAASDYPRDVLGFSVTIPYKEDIIPLLSEVEESARVFGAVNCVAVRECEVGSSPRLCGYNTDAYGFLKSVELLCGGTCGDECGGG